jgi:phage baseplate assembly protein W
MTQPPPPPLLGWPLLPLPDARGGLQWPDLETSITENIKVILLTQPGEQLMRPRYGAGLERLLHEPNTLATRRRIHECVAEALSRWERRISVDQIEVLEIPDQPDRLRVEISYRLLRTGSAASLGLTLRLEGAV